MHSAWIDTTLQLTLNSQFSLEDFAGCVFRQLFEEKEFLRYFMPAQLVCTVLPDRVGIHCHVVLYAEIGNRYLAMQPVRLTDNGSLAYRRMLV